MSQKFVESLEDRRFFAAQPIALTGDPGLWVATGQTTAPSLVTPAEPAAATTAPVSTTRATDLTGAWAGTAKARIDFLKQRVDADVTITAQTETSITGTIAIGDQSYTGTFGGMLNAKTGKFKYVMLSGDNSVTLAGKLSRDGSAAAGTIRAVYAGVSLKGSFRVEKPGTGTVGNGSTGGTTDDNGTDSVDNAGGGTTTPTVRATDFKGDWTGRVKAKLFIFSKKFDAELHITGQTDTTLTGKIEIDGHDFSGTFTGKINPATGRFRWEVKDDGNKLTLVGRLNTAGTVLVGDVEAHYAGFKVKGSFEFTKDA